MEGHLASAGAGQLAGEGRLGIAGGAGLGTVAEVLVLGIAAEAPGLGTGQGEAGPGIEEVDLGTAEEVGLGTVEEVVVGLGTAGEVGLAIAEVAGLGIAAEALVPGTAEILQAAGPGTAVDLLLEAPCLGSEQCRGMRAAAQRADTSLADGEPL